jgi:H+/Cl- antiporter ClcA
MEDLAKALTLPFVAGLVVQRILEILDPITAKFLQDHNTKKIVLAFASLGLGCALCGYADIRIFHALQTLFPGFRNLPCWLDIFATGIFISAGTEGFNSLLKFANYKKEASKADAAGKKSQLTAVQLRSVNL